MVDNDVIIHLRWAGVVLPKNASKSAAEQTGTQPQPLGPGALEFATVTRFYDMLELSDAEIDYISSQIERVFYLSKFVYCSTHIRMINDLIIF